MSTTDAQPNADLSDRLVEFLQRYVRDDVLELANGYPNDQRSLVIDWADLHTFGPDIADDYLASPSEMRDHLEEALVLFDLPVDIDLSSAHVRVTNLPSEYTYFPGEFSPTEEAGHFRAIEGEISKATDVYSKIVSASFECQLCGTLTHVPQRGDGDFQEPHECQGCERKGPFHINFDRSEFIDAQQFRIQTPPEVASGAGTELDVFVEDDLADAAAVGDRVTVTGELHIEQQSNGQQKSGKFDPYLEGEYVQRDQTDHRDLDVTPEERERIHELADGEEGDPLDLAAESLAPKLYGYEHIKRMLVLSMIGGSRVEYGSGDFDRGEFHMLLLGDPGTGKSKLVDRVEQLGWRTVGVSGKGATAAGITASATQDDFGEGDWSLSAGAFVAANRGVLCVDELDDMDPQVRAAMLEPMSKQSIHISKAGINATLPARTAVVAAANPKYGRFDDYEPMAQQFDLEHNLLSRFDLVFTLQDKPNEETDATIAGHILDARDAAKRAARGQEPEEGAEVVDPPVEGDLLRKWVALAKQQSAPPFESADVKDHLKESFNTMRGVYDYDDEAPVPVTWRKLEGIVRVAEAAAKFEFSETIRERHAKIATNAVGRSMQDFGKNEDGEFDADVQETGTSNSQKERKKLLREAINELEDEYDSGVPRETVIEHMTDEWGVDASADRLHADMDTMLNEGVATEPMTDHIRYLGRV